MQSKHSLVLDARKAFDSGIGTYIRNLIPFLKEEFDIKLIGKKEVLAPFECPVIPCEAKAYSLSDFYLPSLIAGKNDIFWTPHFNTPLIKPNAKLWVVNVYDLYHKAHWDVLSFKQKVVYALFLNNLSRNADLIFTISDFTRSEIEKYYPSALAKVQTIHLGIDFELFRPSMGVPMPNEIRSRYNLPEKYLLFVGNLKPNKNVITLLKAYHMLTEKTPGLDVKIVIAGKKEGFRIGDNEAVDYILTNGLEGRVVFTGFVEDEHLPLLYQNATLFVFPSLYEGFGFPPLEAMACGCPVAASTSASIPEVCQNYASYFDGRSPESLKELLEELLGNTTAMKDRALEAQSWVKRYDWALTAEKHIRALKISLAYK